MVPCYLAELTEKIAQDDRIQIIKASMAKLKEFMSFCEAMELVPEEELESSAQGGSNSFADRRAKKIARFKRQRAAESKLLEIKERKERRGRSTKASALSTPVEAAEEDLLDDDVEEEREAWLTSISLAICKAFDLLEMLKKEEEMLSAIKERQLQLHQLSRQLMKKNENLHMVFIDLEKAYDTVMRDNVDVLGKKVVAGGETTEGDKDISQVLDKRTKRAEAWHRDAADRAHYTRPAQPITCATFAQDVIEGRAKVSQAHEHKHQPMIFGPASLVGGNPTSERERMAVQVFQPSYRLPTMSIEEAGLNEMEIMNKFQERNAKLMEEANSSWYKDNRKLRPGEEEDEDDDAAQDKARAWDDWKDDNPRGAGNKKLTPCG
ncbi:unnamed protein product [Camellia sinensis]